MELYGCNASERGEGLARYNSADKECCHLAGLYFHGDLESKIGFDLVYALIDKNDYVYNTPEYKQSLKTLVGMEYGKQSVVVHANGQQYNAIAFVWEGFHHPYTGLICLESDKEFMRDAEEKFQRKAVVV